MDARDLSNRFTYHPPVTVSGVSQAGKYNHIRNLARDLAVNLDDVCPDSRELSLAITHLEEAVFWANASIARHETEGDE